MYAFREEANCADTDPEAFFAIEGTSAYPSLKLIQRICGSCIVKDQCLDYALKHEVLGYWGNTTDFQRKKLRTQLNIIPRQLHLDYS